MLWQWSYDHLLVILKAHDKSHVAHETLFGFQCVFLSNRLSSYLKTTYSLLSTSVYTINFSAVLIWKWSLQKPCLRHLQLGYLIVLG